MNPSSELFAVLKGVADLADVKAAVKTLSIVFDTALDSAKKKNAIVNTTYPSLSLEFRNSTLPSREFPKVFGNVSANTGNVDYSVPGEITFLLTLTYQDDNRAATKLVAAEDAIDKFLFGLHPKAGKQWVENIRVEKSARDEKNRTTGDVTRTVTRRTIIVSVRPMMSLLKS